MAFKIDIKKFVLSILFSIITITIISYFLSQFTSIPQLKTGIAFIIIFIGIYVTMIFTVAHDAKFEKNEIWMLVLVAVALVISTFALRTYLPQIFSVLPDPLKTIVGGT